MNLFSLQITTFLATQLICYLKLICHIYQLLATLPIAIGSLEEHKGIYNFSFSLA